MGKNKIALILFIIGLIFLFAPRSITGSVVGENLGNFSYFNILGFIFLIVSIIIFAMRKSLDVIVIPTGGSFQEDIERTKQGEEEIKNLKNTGYVTISGYYDKGDVNKIRESQVYRIYKHLREHGVVPRDIMVEGRSHDTEENLLYSLKKIEERAKGEEIKKPLDVGFVSYPGHLERFEDFYEVAVKKGLINENDFKFHKIPTDETEDERVYEKNQLRKFIHKYKLRRVERFRSKKGKIKYVKPDKLVMIVKKVRNFLSS